MANSKFTTERQYHWNFRPVGLNSYFRRAYGRQLQYCQFDYFEWCKDGSGSVPLVARQHFSADDLHWIQSEFFEQICDYIDGLKSDHDLNSTDCTKSIAYKVHRLLLLHLKPETSNDRFQLLKRLFSILRKQDAIAILRSFGSNQLGSAQTSWDLFVEVGSNNGVDITRLQSSRERTVGGSRTNDWSRSVNQRPSNEPIRTETVATDLPRVVYHPYERKRSGSGSPLYEQRSGTFPEQSAKRVARSPQPTNPETVESWAEALENHPQVVSNSESTEIVSFTEPNQSKDNPLSSGASFDGEATPVKNVGTRSKFDRQHSSSSSEVSFASGRSNRLKEFVTKIAELEAPLQQNCQQIATFVRQTEEANAHFQTITEVFTEVKGLLPSFTAAVSSVMAKTKELDQSLASVAGCLNLMSADCSFVQKQPESVRPALEAIALDNELTLNTIRDLAAKVESLAVTHQTLVTQFGQLSIVEGQVLMVGQTEPEFVVGSADAVPVDVESGGMDQSPSVPTEIEPL